MATKTHHPLRVARLGVRDRLGPRHRRPGLRAKTFPVARRSLRPEYSAIGLGLSTTAQSRLLACAGSPVLAPAVDGPRECGSPALAQRAWPDSNLRPAVRDGRSARLRGAAWRAVVWAARSVWSVATWPLSAPAV